MLTRDHAKLDRGQRQARLDLAARVRRLRADLPLLLAPGAPRARTRRAARRGIYVEVEAIPGWDLAISSFEQTQGRDPHQRVEVVAVRTDISPATLTTPEMTIQRATVFIPDGKVTSFVKRFETYASVAPLKPREQRHHNFADRHHLVGGLAEERPIGKSFAGSLSTPDLRTSGSAGADSNSTIGSFCSPTRHREAWRCRLTSSMT
jgi:hypothetical protein